MKHNKKLNLILIALGLVFLVSSTFAQNFTNNTGGTYTAAACGAVVKMKSISGQFNGSAQLGTSAANRIQGVVDWAATSNGQSVQGLYYTNLFVSGGTKTIEDGVYVSGTGCPSPLPGYAQLTGGVGYWATSGNRTYNGIFHYDGSAAQVIFPENGGSGNTNRYKDLDLVGGGAKSNTATVEVNEELTTAAGTDLTVGANFTVYGTGTSTVAGGITVNGTNTTTLAFVGSGATVNASGNVTVTTGLLDISVGAGSFNVASTGTLSLANGDGTTGSRLNLGANSNLNIAGTYTNTDANHDNMTFDVTSTVAYTATSGTQNIVFTSDANSNNNYGNLTFSGAALKDATGDIHTRGNVSVSGGRVQMGTSCGLTGNIFYANATGGNKITYGSANNDEYIQGNVRYRGTFSTGTAYTFNNAQTQVTFNTAPDSYFTINSQPNTIPQNNGGFNVAYDLKRCVTIDYDGTNGVISTLKVGYVNGDKDAGFTASESNLRFEEAWGTNATDRHKVTGGAGLATNSGGLDPRYVQLVTNPSLGLKLNNPTNGGTTYELAKASNIVLTAAPLQFIAVNNGRWTNPGTWDEGAVPSSNDNTLIRALVYAGIDGPAYGTPASGNTTSERDHYGVPISQNEIQIAHSITIDNGTTYPDAALIIGNEDNNDNAILTTAMSGTVGGIAAGFYNNNSVANSPDNDSWNNKSTDPAGTNSVNGLFVSSIKNSGYTNVPIFGTGQITNAGTIVNYSIIEIGQ